MTVFLPSCLRGSQSVWFSCIFMNVCHSLLLIGLLACWGFPYILYLHISINMHITTCIFGSYRYFFMNILPKCMCSGERITLPSANEPSVPLLSFTTVCGRRQFGCLSEYHHDRVWRNLVCPSTSRGHYPPIPPPQALSDLGKGSSSWASVCIWWPWWIGAEAGHRVRMLLPRQTAVLVSGAGVS